jgi:hypothetical protein
LLCSPPQQQPSSDPAKYWICLNGLSTVMTISWSTMLAMTRLTLSPPRLGCRNPITFFPPGALPRGKEGDRSMNSFCSTVTCHKVDAADAICPSARYRAERWQAPQSESATAFLQTCLMQPLLADSGASLAVLLSITALRPDPGSYHPKHSIPERSGTAAAHQKQLQPVSPQRCQM